MLKKANEVFQLCYTNYFFRFFAEYTYFQVQVQYNFEFPHVSDYSKSSFQELQNHEKIPIYRQDTKLGKCNVHYI